MKVFPYTLPPLDKKQIKVIQQFNTRGPTIRNRTVKIPNKDRAVVDIKKLREYCLNDNHPRGKHKARVFRSALGLTREDSAWLKEKLLEAVRTNAAEKDRSDRFGQRYVIDFEVETKGNKETIRSKWIVREEESFPRFVTCFII